jgi:beta-catenin-like protein 1
MSPQYVAIIYSFRRLTYSQQYRRRDPTDADEAEFVENVFDSLCSALVESEIKDLFLKSEGVDLMVLMMKYILLFFSELVLTFPRRDKMQVRSRAVKTLDHAMSGHAGTEACNVFVEASGLKYLFNAFMGKVRFD